MKDSSHATTSASKIKMPPKPKSKRRRSRELVLQGVYQWRTVGGKTELIENQLRESDLFSKIDEKFFIILFRGVLKDAAILEKHIQPFLDRPLKDLSPVEISILLVSTYELVNFIETPYRAIINEAIELARSFGGTDGYKYVNGVLDKLAVALRTAEVQSSPSRK